MQKINFYCFFLWRNKSMKANNFFEQKTEQMLYSREKKKKDTIKSSC